MSVSERGIDIKNKRNPKHSSNLNVPLNNENIAASYASTASRISDYARRMSTVKLASSPSIANPSLLNLNSADDLSPRSKLLSTNSQNFSSSQGSTIANYKHPQQFVDVDNPSFVSNVKDQQKINEQTIGLYFNDNLNTEGGDITHELKIQNNKLNNNKSTELRKSRSSADLLGIIDNRRGSTASGLQVPGGFRREFIVNKHRERAILNDEELKQVPFLTKNFMEFLFIYGHFAGETFDDDFNVWNSDHSINDEAIADESTSLLSSPKRYEAKGTTSTLKAFFIMLKAFVGTGVLFLPKAFDNGGLLYSSIMLVVFGIYSYYCYYILISCKQASNVSSFGGIGGKLYGEWMKNVILSSLVLTQIGFTCAYIIFTAENLSAFLKNSFRWKFNIVYIYVFQCLLFIPLSFVRNVSKLSLTSFLANIFIFAGLIIVLFFSSWELIENGVKDSCKLIINKSEFSVFIGTAIFAFEGIGLIIPIQDSMKHPEKFPLVLGLVIITITILMLTIAIIGYLAFGSDIQTVILLNLPQDNFSVKLIQFFYSLAILLSIPLQIFPAIAIIEKKIFNVSGKYDFKIKWSKNLFRSIIVIICINISWFSSNNLDKFVSFVGCFACIPLVYMYPPMLHLKTNPEYKVSDYLLLIVGAASMAYSSYQIIFSS
ncbi:hypothetical protein WICMUC_000130 [Wickerhamomyces mucosus]|uniref:Amino acid transporter transmembrane domain-containing protein n=1 Tax=Wickerhamomyces mucosus TaxID=1378264 RepID=A0A9P8TJ68_9ASCO|nr:hypothetical protein WICMUC_000130 [Wickerhamomyces mucosus]